MRLLRPAASCPHCGCAPRIRITEGERETHEFDPPERPIQSYQCHRCHSVYMIEAKAFQGAA